MCIPRPAALKACCTLPALRAGVAGDSRGTSWLDNTQVGGAPTLRWRSIVSSMVRLQQVGSPWADQVIEVERGVQLVVAQNGPVGAVADDGARLLT